MSRGEREHAVPELCERDWLDLLNGIHRLHEQAEPAGLAATMLDVVRQVIHCDHSSYDEVDLQTRTTTGFCSDPTIDRRWPEVQDAAAAHFHEHPVLHFFQRHPGAGARRITDFVTAETFRKTGLYRECYRHIGVDHQLVMRLPGDTGTEIGLALNRSGADFDETDRRRLDLLRPHLHQAYHRCLSTARLKAQLAASATALDSLAEGVLIVDGDGRVVFQTPRAARLMTRFLPVRSPDPGRLPDPLGPWMKRLAQPDRRLVPVENPLQIEAPHGRLIVTAHHHPDLGAWVLGLEEHSAEAVIPALRRLGLTPRQAHVLYWVTRGKSNPEIAFTLRVSPRTVQKHLEHVFQVLGVQSRTTATVKAMQAINRWR